MHRTLCLLATAATLAMGSPAWACDFHKSPDATAGDQSAQHVEQNEQFVTASTLEQVESVQADQQPPQPARKKRWWQRHRDQKS